MPKAQFGIIEHVEETSEFKYDPEKYGCIPINDDYLDDWWSRLSIMKTYFHCLSRPELGLARYGITLIPPESLPLFQDIVLSDPRINQDDHLPALAYLLQKAIEKNKYVIHFGI